MTDVEAGAARPALPVDFRLKRNRTLAFTIAFLLFAADQLAKWIVTVPLDLRGQPDQIITIFSFFDLHWTENRGVSLGLLSADGDVGRWLLVAMTAGIATFVGLWMWRERKRADAVALAMVLGGALGNIVDRARLGYVVDYADLHFGEWRPFLVFNVGDAAITIGVLLLLVRALLMRDGKAPKKDV
jgi:signal peptidase II